MKTRFLIQSLTVLLLSCGNEQKKEDTQTAVTQENSIVLTNDQYKNAGIETGQVSSKNISSTLKLNGKIDVPPQSMISVCVPMGGYLKSTKLMNGMQVHKGEVLALMEDVQYVQLQQDYLTAKAQLTLVESEYKRQKELNQSKASSDKIVEQTNANYQTQLITIKSLEEKLKLIGLNPQKLTAETISNNIHVYSPITGFVSAVNVNVGKYVNPGDVLFELVDPADIHLTLTVFEKDINKLTIGQKLRAFTNTDSQKGYECEIILISKNLENNNATQVHCHFKHYDKSLLPGMFMTANVELAANTVMALQEEAVVRFENKHYVFIAKDQNNFEMVQVQIGNTENGFTEIASGNLVGKTLVTKGAYNLLMAMKNKGEE